MIRLEQALRGVARLGIDSAPFVYLIENSPCYARVLASIFKRIDSVKVLGCTSTVTLVEVLTPSLCAGDLAIQSSYRELLLQNSQISVAQVAVTTGLLAAEIWAKYGLRTPDALQVASAIESGCQAFLTNDGRLRNITEIKVLILDDLRV